MQRIVNGTPVEIPESGNGIVRANDVRSAAGIPADRTLIVQGPDGQNKLAPKGAFNIPQGYSIADVPAHKRGGWLNAPSPIFFQHINDLSYGCSVDVADDYSYIIVQDVLLPYGYNFTHIPVLIQIPQDYNLSPPGIGNNRIFMPSDLRFFGLKPKDLHPNVNFQSNSFWSWWCYEKIKWDPHHDDLITLLEMIRADMDNPEM